MIKLLSKTRETTKTKRTRELARDNEDANEKT